MSLRFAFLAPISLALLILVGCNRQVDLFQLEVQAERPPGGAATGDGTSSTVVIGLREEPAQKPAAEGYLLEAGSATPQYTLESELAVPDEGQDWVFALRDPDRPLTIVLTGPGGNRVAARSFSPISAADQDEPASVSIHRIVVPVPGGASVAGFHVSGSESPAPVSSGPEHNSPRLIAVAASSGNEVTRMGISESREGLLVGAGVFDATWGERDGDSTVWSLITDPASWNPLDPVEILYEFAPTPQDSADEASASPGPVPPRVSIQVGAAALELSVRPGSNRVVVYPAVYAALATDVTVRSGLDGFAIVSITPDSPPAPLSAPLPAPLSAPLSADLGTILEYPPDLWRSEPFELFRWTLFPEVLLVDTRDYLVQSRFFKRLAFFTEKEGFRGQVLSDAELAGRHGYNAHNYNAEGLAAFFNAVEIAGVALTDEELLLRRIGMAEGLIVEGPEGYAPGTGGILSISQESRQTPGLRELLLTHEAYHGVHYASAEYVQAVALLWDSLSDDERRFWTLLLDGMQYDVTDPDLMRNEFHAYLLQQPVDYASWYFEQRSAGRLRRWKPQESLWLDGFFAEYSGAFERRAAEANDILFAITGLAAGDVFGLSRAAR